MSACQGCGVEIPSSRGPRPRLWCSNRCRQRTTYSRSCVDCGKPTYNATSSPPERCSPCTNRHNAFWTKEKIIDAINSWADLMDGKPPSAVDWNAAQAIATGHPEKAERYRSGSWPALSVVQYVFGSWNAAVTAAGFSPNPSGRPPHPRSQSQLRVCAEIAERYVAGESSVELAHAYGLHANTIRGRIRAAGVEIRDQFESQQLRRQKELVV